MLAKCLLRRGDAAYRMYRKVCPIYRGLAPERYQARPYITSGNVAGPDSACFGRGSWTWYTGSAAWMLKVVIEGICSVARRVHRRAAVCSRHQSGPLVNWATACPLTSLPPTHLTQLSIDICAHPGYTGD